MHCPICRRQADPSPNNPFRPFCSERCRTIDLAAWASDSYRLPGEEADERVHSAAERDRRDKTPGSGKKSSG
jgi:endogenous inhibitor of DNA gyrase (YacG/DUF329 family)